MDWDACGIVDWEALYAASQRHQNIWQALGNIINATDYSDDWSSSYNMSSNWSSSYNMSSNWSSSVNMTMTNGAYVNWTTVDNFDL